MTEYHSKTNDIIEELTGVRPPDPSYPNSFDAKVEANAAYSKQALDYENDPDRFHGKRTPSAAVLNETPEHRQMILLKSMSMTNKEIAEAMGYSQIHVGNVLRQPWAKQRLVKILTEAGKDPLKVLIESAAIDSVSRLIELRDAPDTPKAVAKAACDSLLDRFLGKPTQHIESKTEVTNVPKEIAAVELELKHLAEEEKRLGINVIKN
jgi:hypothetical protein